MDSREQFEQIFSKPPFEFSMNKYSDDEAWPGDYRAYTVKCAWEGWQASRESLVVELPKKYIIDGVPVVTVAELKIRLDKAGIRWK